MADMKLLIIVITFTSNVLKVLMVDCRNVHEQLCHLCLLCLPFSTINMYNGIRNSFNL